MIDFAKNASLKPDSQTQSWISQLNQHSTLSQEQIIAIQLEYHDIDAEDWKVHLAQSS